MVLLKWTSGPNFHRNCRDAGHCQDGAYRCVCRLSSPFQHLIDHRHRRITIHFFNHRSYNPSLRAHITYTRAGTRRQTGAADELAGNGGTEQKSQSQRYYILWIYPQTCDGQVVDISTAAQIANRNNIITTGIITTAMAVILSHANYNVETKWQDTRVERATSYRVMRRK